VSSRSDSETANQRPRLHVRPPAAKTFGDIAAHFASDYDLTPDPWQLLVLEDWLAVDHAGLYAALTCGLACPRQNGKNGIIEVRELFGMVGRGEKFLHTAHEVKTARKAFKRLQHFFGRSADDPAARFPELNALVSEVRNVNGQEAIYLHNGGSVEILARSKGSGRGYTVDCLVMDEAQDLSDDDLEALLSTTSAAPLGNPQWIFTGTPPGPKVNGEVFTRTRNEALEGKAKRLAWHEWSCAGEVDLDDTEVWALANPGLGRRLQMTVIEGERARFSDDGFARERLGMWAGSSGRSVIDPETWSERADVHSIPAGQYALAVDVSPDRTMASVGFAGQRRDGAWHVELDEQRHGVGWLAAYVTKRCERNDIRAVVIDGASPAASIIDDLRQRKIKVTTTGARDMAGACGTFYDGVMEGWLLHIDQPQLNVALSVARKRSLGDAWAWNRKSASSDITPLVACTLALWGAQSSTVNKPMKRSIGRREAVVL
jgi:phage terminase large subunit-like protein